MNAAKRYWLVPVLVAAALNGCAAPPTDAQPPNFIVLLADDLGYGDLGAYGHPTIRTPNLDQLAREGVRFTQFYAPAALCTPSRAGLLTGALPVRTGMAGRRGVLFPDSDGGLPASASTIAEALQAVGYRTALVGKWHLGHLPRFSPLAHGFDYFFGLPYSNDMRPENEHWDYARETFPPLPLMENDKVVQRGLDQATLTARFTAKAIEFIETHSEEPFLLYLPYTAPHTPLAISATRRAQAVPSQRGLYGDVVEELDWSAGEIIATVKRLGLSTRTFVLFTSDNGPWGWRGVNGGSAGLLRGAKGSPWEGGFRVPAIAWMPDSIPADRTVTALGSMLDVYPTLLAMAGAATASSPDGVNILPTLMTGEAVRDSVFYYRQEELAAVRQGQWKLFLRHPDAGAEGIDAAQPLLFNVENDPSERYDLAQEQPERVADLLRLAQSHTASFTPPPSRLNGILPEYEQSYAKHHRDR